MSKITVYPDNASLISGAAEFVAGLAVQAIATRGLFIMRIHSSSAVMRGKIGENIGMRKYIRCL